MATTTKGADPPLGLFRQVAAMATAGHLINIAWAAVARQHSEDALFVGVSSRDTFAVIPHSRLRTLMKSITDAPNAV